MRLPAILSGWRARLRSASAKRPAGVVQALSDPWIQHSKHPPLDDPIERLLCEIESTALATYRANGLPVRPGHYIRSPKGARWKFVADVMTPQDRWDLALSKSSKGWRFALLDDLGRDVPIEAVQAAARLLAGCRCLRARLRDRDPGTLREDMETAVRLGAEWQVLLQSGLRRDRGRLKLMPPLRDEAPG